MTTAIKISELLSDFDDHGFITNILNKTYESKESEKSLSIQRESFKEMLSKKIAVYGYLIKIAGLSTNTSKYYRWFLRTIIYSCAVLCLINLFARTTGYVSILFDFTLVSLHFWVCYSYEIWTRYLRTTIYKDLITIVAFQQTAKFERQMKILGTIGMILIPIACVFLIIGWLYPIYMKLDEMEYKASSHYVFMALHLALMSIIIIPWSCVCFGSLFSFHFLLTAHKTDMLEHLCQLIPIVSENLDYRVHITNFKKIKKRIRFTSAYFHTTYIWFIINGMLLLSTVIYKIGKHEPYEFNQIFQFIFYAVLGLLSFIIGIFSISSINGFWKKLFLEKMNDLLHEMRDTNTKIWLHNYYNSNNIAYKLFRCYFTEEITMILICFFVLVILLILLL
jgi:hypothetical protein